jgi:hypothetical protein
MNPNPANPQLAEADLDRALATSSDSMTAVYREASAPAPLAFPWKRAIPGIGAVVVAAALLIAAVVSFFHSALTRSAPAVFDLQRIANPLTHHATDALWLSVSLVLSLACLLFCRRLVSPR